MEVKELTDIITCLYSGVIFDGRDSWNSSLSLDGNFYVRDLRNLIDTKLTDSVDNPTIWFS